VLGNIVDSKYDFIKGYTSAQKVAFTATMTYLSTQPYATPDFMTQKKPDNECQAIIIHSKR
jgi:hypothetical protein